MVEKWLVSTEWEWRWRCCNNVSLALGFPCRSVWGGEPVDINPSLSCPRFEVERFWHHTCVRFLFGAKGMMTVCYGEAHSVAFERAVENPRRVISFFISLESLQQNLQDPILFISVLLILLVISWRCMLLHLVIFNLCVNGLISLPTDICHIMTWNLESEGLYKFDESVGVLWPKWHFIVAYMVSTLQSSPQVIRGNRIVIILDWTGFILFS